MSITWNDMPQSTVNCSRNLSRQQSYAYCPGCGFMCIPVDIQPTLCPCSFVILLCVEIGRHPAHPSSVLVLHPTICGDVSYVQALCSVVTNYDTDIIHRAAVHRLDNAMPCHAVPSLDVPALGARRYIYEVYEYTCVVFLLFTHRDPAHLVSSVLIGRSG